MVDFNELADKAKGLVSEHADQIKSGIAKTGDFVGDKIGHDKVNPLKAKAAEFIDKLAGDQAPKPSAEPAAPPTPPAAQEPAAPAPEPPAQSQPS
jgi:hypothetical protein